jgi:hypothetical protein
LLRLANCYERGKEKILVPSIVGFGVHYHVASPANLPHNGALEGREEFSNPLSGGLVDVFQAVGGVLL